MSIPAALPAQADLALGFGLSFLLGGSSSASSNQTGLALRVFSNDVPPFGRNENFQHPSLEWVINLRGRPG